MKIQEIIKEGVESKVDFLSILEKHLNHKYPSVSFIRKSDRIESEDGQLTVIAHTFSDDDRVGVYMWDVATGPYTNVLVPAIKEATEQLLNLSPGSVPVLAIGEDESAGAWEHIAAKLGYELEMDE
jgi:hypothetical protein